MTDHLPECDVLHIADDDDGAFCICRQLRACEQRVRDSILGNYRSSIVYDNGYEDGVHAARDAVAALPWKSDETDFSLGRADGLGKALAAIDALGGSDADR